MEKTKEETKEEDTEDLERQVMGYATCKTPISNSYWKPGKNKTE